MKRVGQGVIAAAITLLLFLLPFARHWIIVNRPVAGVYYEQTSFLFYLSDVAVLLLLLVEGVMGTRRNSGELGEQSAVSSEQSAVSSEQSAVSSQQSAVSSQQSAVSGPAFTIHHSPFTIHHSPFPPLQSLILLPLTTLTILALLSPLRAADAGLALYSGLRLMGLFLLVVALVRLRPRTILITFGLSLTVLFQAGLALIQFVRQNDFGWQQWGEVDMAIPGLTSIIRVGDAQFIRGYGLTPHPNILGGLLVALLLVLVTTFLQSRRRGRSLTLLVLISGAGGLIITFSRAAWLAGVVGGGWLLLLLLLTPTWRQTYARLITIPIVAALLLLTIAFAARPDLFLARLIPSASYTETRSLDERDALAQLARQLIRVHPWTGVGGGGFPQVVATATEGMANVRPQPVHHVPLLVASELGLAAGLLWVWLMFAPLVGALITWRQQRLTLWAAGLTGALLALAVIDLFDFYSWGWAQGRLLRWTLWGLWLNAITDQRPEI